jgi:hypothetical protein
VQFIAGKNTFGYDEALDIISNQGGLVSSAFWVQIDGLSQQAFENLGIGVGAFTGAYADAVGSATSRRAQRGRSSRTA